MIKGITQTVPDSIYPSCILLCGLDAELLLDFLYLKLEIGDAENLHLPACADRQVGACIPVLAADSHPAVLEDVVDGNADESDHSGAAGGGRLSQRLEYGKKDDDKNRGERDRDCDCHGKSDSHCLIRGIDENQ